MGSPNRPYSRYVSTYRYFYSKFIHQLVRERKVRRLLLRNNRLDLEFSCEFKHLAHGGFVRSQSRDTVSDHADVQGVQLVVYRLDLTWLQMVIDILRDAVIDLLIARSFDVG